MDCMVGWHHQLPELIQTHVHWAGDAIQPSHSLSSPSPPAFNCSQYWGSLPMSQFFASGDQSIGVSDSASVLPMNIQDWFHLGWTGWISLLSKGLSRVFYNTAVQKHQFYKCTGKTQRDGMGREVGGGIGMGNTCKSMADSCQCMGKTTTIL